MNIAYIEKIRSTLLLTVSLAGVAAVCGGCIPTNPAPLPEPADSEITLTEAVDIPAPKDDSGVRTPEDASPAIANAGMDLSTPEETPAPVVKPAANPSTMANSAATAGSWRVHVVSAGQTLWKISGIYYGKSSRDNVQKILLANPAITNPNKIYVGQKINIPR